MKRTRKALAMIALLVIALAAPIALAQEASTAAQPAKQAPKPFKEEELAALLAPIALYPDAVVTQILIASTYPLEVVQANRWLQQNPSLKGEALAKAAEQQPWDPSVQGLVAIPDVLKMMDEKLDWTQKVGDAFLGQQKEVMAMVQTLRRKAQEAGNLKSDEKMKVTTEAAAATTTTAAAPVPQVIIIESQNPQVVYVPTYSPVTIYGTWGYPAYPPYYYPPPVAYPGAGFWYGAAIGISIGYWGGHYNNCYPDWHGGDINIGEVNIGNGNRGDINGGNRGQATPRDGSRGASAGTMDRGASGGGQKWQHDPSHRQGVSYRDSGSQSKYGGANSASAGTRDAYRGRDSGGGASAGTMDRGAGGSTRNAGSSPGAGTMDRGASGGGSMRELGPTPSDIGRSGGGSAGASAGATSRTSSSSGGSSSGGSRGGSSAFGGMNSGSSASSYGSRGGASRGGGGGRGGRR